MTQRISRRTLHPPTWSRRVSPRYSAERGPETIGVSTHPEYVEEARVAAILAYVPFLCIIALTRFRHNRFAFNHGVQGLILTVIEVVVVLSLYFSKVFLLLCFLLALVGVVMATQNREFRIPYLGDWIERL